MALRTTCLCDGRIIGIESIFSVIGGKQINIPEKVEELRKRSRNNELFCTCGCGANLVLVASDRNLREQHFRIKDGQSEEKCQYISESDTSKSSKIVLKCWLDEKLDTPHIESRVPICAIEDSDRKYEMTFLVPDRRIAVSYCNDRANLSDEKLSILDANREGIKIIYVTDTANAGNGPQYPEMMMKIQKRQGFCLFLQLHYANGKSIPDYSLAELKVCSYLQATDGAWAEVPIAEGKLSEFAIGSDGMLSLQGQSLSLLMAEKETVFHEDQKRKIEEQEKAAAEWQKAQDEKQRQAKEREAQAILLREQQTQRYEEELSRIRVEREKRAREKREETRRQIASVIDQRQEEPLYDSERNRWIKCDFCGLVETEDKFLRYGGPHHANRGTCKECHKNGLDEMLPIVISVAETQPITNNTDPMICPACGGTLKERYGRYGKFYGCMNFPACHYTRNGNR